MVEVAELSLAPETNFKLLFEGKLLVEFYQSVPPNCLQKS